MLKEPKYEDIGQFEEKEDAILFLIEGLIAGERHMGEHSVLPDIDYYLDMDVKQLERELIKIESYFYNTVQTIKSKRFIREKVPKN
uniref:Uncharacterized protein n=1 Tax=Marseillevirus LCMAC201 TaxID=2506605 RepID=A0A481YVU9_9VIRU|nr:MAG: hypothetical protein LCMAC201_03130 [Marseillevirus LCMAC201]